MLICIPVQDMHPDRVAENFSKYIEDAKPCPNSTEPHMRADLRAIFDKTAIPYFVDEVTKKHSLLNPCLRQMHRVSRIVHEGQQ